MPKAKGLFLRDVKFPIRVTNVVIVIFNVFDWGCKKCNARFLRSRLRDKRAGEIAAVCVLPGQLVRTSMGDGVAP